MNTVYSRILIKRSNISGVEPTIPISDNHNDGSWLSTDLYDGEMFLNTADKKCWARSDNTIMPVNAHSITIEGLGDVDILGTPGATDGQILVYDAASESWVNEDPSCTSSSVLKELDFNAGAVSAGPRNPASWVPHGIKAVWEFSDNKDNEVVAAINFPKDMDLTVAPTIKICWSSNTTSEDAVWELEYLYRQIDEDTTDAAQETLTQVAESSSTADGFTCTDFTGLDIPSEFDKTVFLRITRLSSDGDDTLGGTAELHSIIFVYTSDKLGEAI